MCADIHYALWSNIFTLLSSLSVRFVFSSTQNYLGLVLQICKPKPCCHILFTENRLSNLLAEACGARDAALGFFPTFQSISEFDLGVILLEHALPRKLETVIFLRSRLMDFKLFENGLITLPRLMGSKMSSKMIDGVFPR